MFSSILASMPKKPGDFLPANMALYLSIARVVDQHDEDIGRRGERGVGERQSEKEEGNEPAETGEHRSRLAHERHRLATRPHTACFPFVPFVYFVD
jgi:hypothetical protein